MPERDKDPSTEVTVKGADGQRYLRFVPRSEAVAQVKAGEADWPSRTLSFEEQMRTPMTEILMPHPSPQLAGKDAKSPRFVPRWQAETMVEMGQAQWPDKNKS